MATVIAPYRDGHVSKVLAVQPALLCIKGWVVSPDVVGLLPSNFVCATGWVCCWIIQHMHVLFANLGFSIAWQVGFLSWMIEDNRSCACFPFASRWLQDSVQVGFLSCTVVWLLVVSWPSLEGDVRELKVVLLREPSCLLLIHNPRRRRRIESLRKSHWCAKAQPPVSTRHDC